VVDPDFLYTVAQVGVTYAGFSTLVTVIAYRSDMKALPARIYYMLLLSVIVIACAFLPTIFLAYELSESTAWQVSSGLFGAVWCAYWINAIVKLKTRFRVWGSLALLNKVNTAVVHPAAIVLLFAGMIGLWGKFTEAVYVTALFIMLYMSAYLFLQIIIDLLDTQPES
jgi:hypothetical protein